jgi:hypothetical protein
MASESLNPLGGIANGIVAFLPNHVAGIGLLVLGLLCARLAKKIIIQLSVFVRLDRIFSRSRWREELSRSDVRHGLYSLIGNIGFFLVLLAFVDNTFIVWRLTILSDLLRQGIAFLPRLILAGVIFAAGMLLASLARRSVLRILVRERIQRATLIARLVQGIPVLFFSAMALVELDVAREIVIIGFAAVIFTLSALAVVFAVRQGTAIRHGLEGDDEEGQSPSSPPR